MTRHLVRMGGLIALILLCTFYPYFPGDYDGLAVPLSAGAQMLGILGLLLVPVGVPWLVHELREQARRQRDLPTRARGYQFGLAAVIVASMVAIAVSLAAYMSTGLSLGVLTLAAWSYIATSLVRGLRSLNASDTRSFNPAPLYLVIVPVVVCILQIVLAARATEVSRHRAVAQSAELLGDIEEYHAAYGRYPSSLLALHEDYQPRVVGIEQFHYAPNGEAYNLFFEQPRFLSDLGIREIVMYNKRDEHIMVSHAAWILAGAPESLEARQGWHSVHDGSVPRWKYFWFD